VEKMLKQIMKNARNVVPSEKSNGGAAQQPQRTSEIAMDD